MFNRYKSSIRYDKINQYVLNNDNYKEVVDNIIKANDVAGHASLQQSGQENLQHLGINEHHTIKMM